MSTKVLRIGNRQFTKTDPTIIMGILNTTPDSFSDGGEHNSCDKAFEFAKTMITDGVDIIDIGGESTRPGAKKISAEIEWQRVSPIIKKISALDCMISIDTYKSEIAQKAVQIGAHIVNDVWGLQHDKDMAKVIADSDVAVVITHNRTQTISNQEILQDIHRFFQHSLSLAEKNGIRSDGIILDPGIGFGKTPVQNEIILNNLQEFTIYEYPILIGVSRKRFIGQILNQEEPQKRLYGTIGANIVALAKGASILRVHDVRAHKEATLVADAILNEGESS